MNQKLDFINVMDYDFNGWPWTTKTANNAPLNDGTSNSVTNSINYYLSQGISASKINMGIPTYGHSWAVSSSNTGYNAPASGPGAAGSATQTAGVLAYYEICLAIKNNGWTKVGIYFGLERLERVLMMRSDQCHCQNNIYSFKKDWVEAWSNDKALGMRHSMRH
jgi:GH18 family chitinase